MENSSIHQQTAQTEQRDSSGHFIKSATPDTHPAPAKQATTTPKNILSRFLTADTKVQQTTDDNTLLDVHFGNPLRRITQLLEELKKQKAFSFTLKGSLGIMGVVFSLSLLGLFGSNKILCNKGLQTEIGTVKVLQVKEMADTIPFLSDFLNSYNYLLFNTPPPASHNRIVLLTVNAPDAIDLIAVNSVKLPDYADQSVIATGQYDACSKQLTISSADGVEKK